MDKLIIVGGGGHARSVVDIAIQNGNFELAGFVDSRSVSLLDLPLLGTDDDLLNIFKNGIHHIFIAIGENHLRNQLFDFTKSIGFEPVNIISPHAVVSPRAKIGNGICIMAGAIVNINTSIEDNCIINTRCSIDHDCQIGKSTHIAPGVTLSGTVSIGEGTHIGTGASVIDGIIIGDWSYIGGGAVVVNNVGSNQLAYGVPARNIRKIISH